MDNTTYATAETRTVYPSGASEFTPRFGFFFSFMCSVFVNFVHSLSYYLTGLHVPISYINNCVETLPYANVIMAA